MLAVFSQPTRTSVLALRRERYALARLIRRIAAAGAAMVELQVVQYGVTRERLAEIADSRDGWDVLHLSGHGPAGCSCWSTRTGRRIRCTRRDLVVLLRPARRRVKLAVVSACESAAAVTARDAAADRPDRAGRSRWKRELLGEAGRSAGARTGAGAGAGWTARWWRCGTR